MERWQPGKSLQSGRFIIEKVLGGGGYGTTYSIREQRTGNIFVLKTLNDKQQSQANFQQRQVKFVNEALRLAQCGHSHIVKVYEVIQEDVLWGMVMEHIDGDDLEVYVQERGTFSEQEALKYIEQIGQALEFVHSKGFLHRDIKPNNILLRRGTQEAVLIDFGLAREFVIGKTKTMTNSMTEGYAPIEQYENRGHFGAYTDVYALAATFYNLLTGEMPFPAQFRKHAQLPPPKQLNPRISDRVSDAIVKGMALEPQERPQTVREWLELINPKSQPENLQSAVGIDYTRLRDLLAAGEWRQADEETARVMLAVSGREEKGCLDVKHIDNFPCKDLRTIDQLWVKYSNRRFGFSVQKRIYQSLGGTRNYDEKIWYAFGDCIGWRKKGEWLYYEDITFNLTAPEAHLPSIGGRFVHGGRGWVVVVSSLASRLVKCNI
ncbi:MAG: GUN4 domain-containing protein [Scytonematopsis contorta HA4267-MV1]|jgi:serine/threonine protein kinase|nr:GUN4 domain-containing protein [Scytonematopsis contorta HA4267-MV1]